MASTKPLPRCRKCGGEPILKSEPTYFWGPPQHRMFCSSCGNGSQRYCFDSEIIAIQEWKKMNQTDENEWVIITDPNHIARKCDERRCEKIAYGWSACYGLIGCRIEDFPDWQFRCRRKDLPPQAEPVKPVHPMCAAMASAAFVPLMHEQADGTICTKSGTIIVPLPDGTLHETAGYIVDLKPASPKIAPAGGPGYAGISDLVADLLTVTCPVTGEIIKLSAEGRKFFSPWMNDDGTFKHKVPLVPKDGYRFMPRDEPVIEGDMCWSIGIEKWIKSGNWNNRETGRQGLPTKCLGPYIRKITDTILDNGDNPNCGSVKPVSRADTKCVDDILRSKRRPLLDRLRYRGDAMKIVPMFAIQLMAEAADKIESLMTQMNPVEQADLPVIDVLLSAKEALDTLRSAIQADDDYAWSWHCNVAMPIQDEGVGHEQANHAAARFMSTLFGVDVTAFDQWKSFPWASDTVADSIVEYTELPDSVKKAMNEVIAQKTGIATAPVATPEPVSDSQYSFVGTTQSSNCAMWGCANCKAIITSPSLPTGPCPWCGQSEKPAVPPVHCGGPYVAREVFNQVVEAATAVIRAASIGDQNFIWCLKDDTKGTPELRAAIVKLGDLLREAE